MFILVDVRDDVPLMPEYLTQYNEETLKAKLKENINIRYIDKVLPGCGLVVSMYI